MIGILIWVGKRTNFARLASVRRARYGRRSWIAPGERMPRIVGFALVLLALTGAQPAFAGWNIPPGGRVDLGGGSASGGGDVAVAGELALSGGSLIGVDSLDIAAAGELSLAAGVLELSGDFANAGVFLAQGGSVRFRDGGVAESAILGGNRFDSLSLVSDTGKRYRLQSGATQSVSTLLEIRGVGAPIQIDTTVEDAVAYIDLADAGTQQIDNVGVSDVHAVGQPLAPDQTNQGGEGNAQGWFGNGTAPGGGTDPAPQLIPVASPIGLAVLALAIALIAGVRRRTATAGVR